MTLFVQINKTNDPTGKPMFEETPKNYNLYASTETAKYTALHIILSAGATLDAISGCGSGYYIQITATPEQATEINRKLHEVRA